MTQEPTHISVNWPVGPDFQDGYGNDATTAWVKYKLGSALWYIDTLEQLGREVDYARFIGVEMALDGAVTALCGAFDAAHRALLSAVYTKASRQLPWTPKVEQFGALLTQEGGAVRQVHEDVERALERDGDRPVGWLVKLRYLRNRTVHEHSLARFIHVQVGTTTGTTTGLKLPGEDVQREPVTYLSGAHDLVSSLCTRLRSAAAPLETEAQRSEVRQDGTAHPSTIMARTDIPGSQ